METQGQRKELQVSAIENGTVIDHIPALSLFQVLHILQLEGYTNQILFGTNLDSHKYGKKGIIKVSDKFFKPEEINKIALFAPTATLIEIRDYLVVKKAKVAIPDELVNMVKCFNPHCITNHEQMTTRFRVVDKTELKVQCHYCEKIMEKDNMVF
ncbi:MAG: aspartate carbamoyltransferase regulatory subunit [Bacteroidales bacterium]|nr:aspartate carbamoyltransferase regulatory subunit [Lentimicrobiaceae bacterium]MDD5695800.1 aspartate carbamoyltransferase regulatory subunit [Bacteroidales bacterium]